jgi:tetratricopeptide (TPR) repeat protein
MYFCRFVFGYYMGEDPWNTYDDARRATAAFGEACAARWHDMAQVMTAKALAALGEHTEVEQRLRRCLERALRSNDALFLSLARVYLMSLLAERCAPDQQEEITELARQLIAISAMENTVGPAYGALARVLMAEGRLSEARKEAEKALAILQHMRVHRPLIYRTLIEILLREGRPDEARKVAEEGLRCLEALGGSSGHSEVPLRLAIAEARAAAGDMASAREALAKTIQVIEAHAAKIPDPTWRARYLDEIPAHVRAQELGRAWLDRGLVEG